MGAHRAAQAWVAAGLSGLLPCLPACLGDSPPVGGGSAATSTGEASSTGVADPDSTGGTTQSAACASYLECLAEADPGAVAEAEPFYGPDGSCWDSVATAVQCTSTCLDRTQELCPEGTGGGTGEPPPLACSIEGLAPGSLSPVDAGEGAEQLPLEVGEVLERNCGCHYLDGAKLDPEVPAYNGAILLDTWADFHTPFMGVPTWQRVQLRTVMELSMPPPFFCDDLDLGSWSQADYDLMAAWLEAGAPDAVRWGGGGG